MKRFRLVTNNDEKRVAVEGVEFTGGLVAVNWIVTNRPPGTYETLMHFMTMTNGKGEYALEWLDEDKGLDEAGLTTDEQAVAQGLHTLWEQYQKLPVQHMLHRAKFEGLLGDLQALVFIRPTLRKLGLDNL